MNIVNMKMEGPPYNNMHNDGNYVLFDSALSIYFNNLIRFRINKVRHCVSQWSYSL